MTFFRIFSIAILGLVIVGAIFPRHGFTDLRKLQDQILRAKSRVAMIEVENQKLKRQVNLFEKPTDDLAEREVRDFLGWVKPNEMVYLERPAKP